MRVARATGLAKLLGLCVAMGVLVAAVLFPVFGGLGVMSNQAVDTIDKVSYSVANVDPPGLTTITDKNGDPIAYLYSQDRVMLRSDQISKTMKAAIVAIEDHRFFEHHGVDWQGIMRAAVKNAGSGSVQGGGSTITQQYVKNYLAFAVTDDVQEGYKKAIEQSAARKLKEIRIALDLERNLAQQGKDPMEVKDEILTRYLNIVPFLYDIYGVAEAARAYFGTTADNLTVPQAALFAAMVNQPGALNPYTNPEGAKKRRDVVIDKMAENQMLEPNDPVENKRLAEQYKNEPLGILPGSTPDLRPNGCINAGPVDGFFCEYVLNYLQRAGIDQRTLKRGGYTIKTTLDPKASEEAKRAAESTVPQNARGVANAVSIVEPGKDRHRVRALVANRDYGIHAERGQRAFALPTTMTGFGAGSIFKIFTTAAYLQEKGGRISQYVSVPPSYTSRVFKADNGPWTVGNAGRYNSSMTLTDALAQSPNTTFVELEEKAGLRNVVDMAYKLGLRDSLKGVDENGRPLKPGDKSVYDKVLDSNMGAFTLGVTPVNALELSNVAATLMSGGKWCPPSPIEEITDRHDKKVPIKEAPCEQVIDEGLANSLVQALSKDDQEGGTSARAARAEDWGDRPIIGKTGTTEYFKSSGFLAATPQYAGAVLVFNDDSNPQSICANPGRQCGLRTEGGAFGGNIAAPTWFRAMKPLHDGSPVKELPQADPRYR
ncbi:transglycosylase domain-containing protein [Longimycelium tulufanense]|uniref:transglycosylase domain-containing protein n=1 Tax=Longimycelium tulufanense TaxID=907463 RepID=UPI001E5769F9|nr:transglycosylase domain-containing protein [Longimycelium tulufanense]